MEPGVDSSRMQALRVCSLSVKPHWTLHTFRFNLDKFPSYLEHLKSMIDKQVTLVLSKGLFGQRFGCSTIA